MRLLLGLLLIVGFTGCTAPPTSALDSDRVKFQKERDDYVAKLKIDLDQADQDIATLKEKARKATGEMKDKIEKKIQELESHRGETYKHYENLKTATHDRWDEFKKGMSSSWDSLKEKIHRAQEEFK